MSVVFDVGRVRRPVFFVFSSRRTRGPKFLGIVTARNEREAKEEATLAWGAGAYLVMEWWRAALAVEASMALEVQVVKRMDTPPSTLRTKGGRRRAKS